MDNFFTKPITSDRLSQIEIQIEAFSVNLIAKLLRKIFNLFL